MNAGYGEVLQGLRGIRMGHSVRRFEGHEYGHDGLERLIQTAIENRAGRLTVPFFYRRLAPELRRSTCEYLRH